MATSTEPTIPSSPIPLALGPTSRIDQLDHSPPHPAEAFSPDGASPLPPSTPPSPLASIPAFSPPKPHPADLVSLEHPDPHGTPSPD